MVYAQAVAVPEILSFREFRTGLAGVLDRVRRSPDAVVFVGAHRRAEAVLVSVEQYEALQEAAERQHAVAAALASVRAKRPVTRIWIRPAACCVICWALPIPPNWPGLRRRCPRHG
jgi:PHD/YefM family antitoxin component YafN of YafNO toxin-antitoxin module